MTPQEMTARCKTYVDQALERLNAIEAKVNIEGDAKGELVSLRRNLESAQSDLETLTKGE